MNEQACRPGRTLFQLLAMMPMAVPGLVFGLAYIVLAQRLPQYRCHPQRRARGKPHVNSAGISFNQVSSARLSAILAIVGESPAAHATRRAPAVKETSNLT